MQGRPVSVKEFEQNVLDRGIATDIEILEFSGVSRECKIFCKICGNVSVVKKASFLYTCRGCKTCGKNKRNNSNSISMDEFVKKVKLLGMAPDINILEFNGTVKPCKIHCNRCGNNSIVRRAKSLYYNRGCKTCADLNCRITLEQFVENVRKRGNASDIDVLEFNGIDKKCKIFCNKCKTFSFVNHAYYLYYNRCCKNCAKIQNNIKCGISIYESHPDVAKHFIDQNFVKNHTCGTHKKAYYKCPDCGDISEVCVSYCFQNGFNCKKCGDKRSFPNKFVYNILKELNIKFISEKRFNWSKNIDGNTTSYDFYIPQMNMIIEANGLQHYEDTFFGKFEYVNANDNYKEYVAKANGITKYVRLNCSESSEKFIINSIKQEKLLYFIDFDKIDIKTVIVNCNKSLLVECCRIFKENPNMSTSDISDVLNLDRHTILSYLKKGSIAGLCSYSKDNALANRKKRAAKNRKKQSVLQFDINNIFISRYESASVASKFTSISACAIRNCCLMVSNSAGGFVWKYEDESLLHKVINKNIANIEKCCKTYNDILDGNVSKHSFSKTRFRTLLKYGSVLGLIEYNPNNPLYKIVRIKDSRKKPISQYSKDGVFIKRYNSYKEAYEKTGINIANIRNAINYKVNLAGGYIWRNI
ncbi:MAG: DUF723 domain-containing protein [Paludibacter sp.]|nr:DUF723 domain-containing protein [Paludibacter sp.]